jgi:hypothetical protein
VSGYTPVFDSVFRGTLFGRWPTLPVWLTILPMADKNGHIDMTYQAISAASGWPIELLKQAIAELMSPDPESRSTESEGRRLELIDPANRQWGWRVVNHRSYREKARKSAFDAARVEDGRNRQRMAERAEEKRPAQTRAEPPSNTNANTYSNTKREEEEAPTPSETEISDFMKAIREAYPKPNGREDWITAEKGARTLVANGEASWLELYGGVQRYSLHVGETGSYAMNPAKFFTAVDRPWSQAWEIPDKKPRVRKTKFAQAMEALERA